MKTFALLVCTFRGDCNFFVCLFVFSCLNGSDFKYFYCIEIVLLQVGPDPGSQTAAYNVCSVGVKVPVIVSGDGGLYC